MKQETNKSIKLLRKSWKFSEARVLLSNPTYLISVLISHVVFPQKANSSLGMWSREKVKAWNISSEFSTGVCDSGQQIFLSSAS